jgi:predicted nuclease of predicted toxin-antitoxin system
LKILFDQGTPAPLRTWLDKHTVVTAYEKGWNTLSNGNLIRSAETEGFDLLVTTDKNLKYQQKLAGRKIAVVVLLSANWPKIHTRVLDVAAAIDGTPPGAYLEIPI